MDKHQIGVKLIVKGRISLVRWLEAAPYNARKVRNGKYFCYVVEMADEAAAHALAAKLDGSDQAMRFRDDSLQQETGVWVETIPVFDDAAIRAEEEAERRAEEAQPIHPAFQGLAEYLRKQGRRATNAMCQEFAVEQIVKLERQMYFANSRHIAAVRDLKRSIEWAATTDVAAQIYGENRAQLQAWAAQYK